MEREEICENTPEIQLFDEFAFPSDTRTFEHVPYDRKGPIMLSAERWRTSEMRVNDMKFAIANVDSRSNTETSEYVTYDYRRLPNGTTKRIPYNSVKRDQHDLKHESFSRELDREELDRKELNSQELDRKIFKKYNDFLDTINAEELETVVNNGYNFEQVD